MRTYLQEEKHGTNNRSPNNESHNDNSLRNGEASSSKDCKGSENLILLHQTENLRVENNFLEARKVKDELDENDNTAQEAEAKHRIYFSFGEGDAVTTSPICRKVDSTAMLSGSSLSDKEEKINDPI